MHLLHGSVAAPNVKIALIPLGEMSHYEGPLRDEPLAVELHNTIYAVAGTPFDGLEAPAAWLEAIAPRLPLADALAGPWPPPAELAGLRFAVRELLAAAIDRRPPDPTAVAAVNHAAGRAPSSPVLAPDGTRHADFHGATRADVVCAAFATDAIALVSGPHRHDLRSCGAPGCVLVFLRDHPRRAWCTNACGNRARQARHYRRTHHPADA